MTKTERALLLELSEWVIGHSMAHNPDGDSSEDREVMRLCTLAVEVTEADAALAERERQLEIQIAKDAADDLVVGTATFTTS